MLSSVLRSDKAIEVNIAIMRIFTKLRSFYALEERVDRKVTKLEQDVTRVFKVVFERLDNLFHALSDSTRREVLVQLCKGPKSVSELAEPFDMALPSFTQHLRVLEGSGLIESKKEGRVRFIYLVPSRFEKLEGWLEKQRKMWEKRFDNMGEYLL